MLLWTLVSRRPRPTLNQRFKLRSATALATVLMGGFFLEGCSSPTAGLPSISDPISGEYHLGPGDQVRIITFEEAQLTGEFYIDASGEIELPLVGSIHAAGLTPHELTTATKELLTRSNLDKRPSVSVEVTKYRPIFILGEVSRPGQYPYQPGMTAVTAVAVAGGFTYRAVQDAFSIVRTINGKTAEGKAERQTPIQPADVITVYERML